MTDRTLPRQLPALTIWQPWAALIIAGLKPFEFRGWPAPAAVIGQRFMIHAGVHKVKPEDIRSLLYRLERDSGMSSCGEVLSPARLATAVSIVREHGLLARGAFCGTAVLGTPVKSAVLLRGRTAPPGFEVDPEQWAWPIEQARGFAPVPATGRQGFFVANVPDEWR